jgi:hypothetical protein
MSTTVIPRLRKAGIYVERSQRPNHRGPRYRLYRLPDEQITVVYSYRALKAWAAHLLDGASMPPPEPIG